MRCTRCGSILPPGVPQCPICGAYPDSAQAQEDYRFFKPYPKTDYQQGIPPTGREYGYGAAEPESQPVQYATPSFHTYRTQKLTGFAQPQQTGRQAQMRDGFSADGAFARAVSDLPQVVRGAFADPIGTLQGMIRRNDRFTGGILLALSLVFAFLAGLVLVKGLLGSLLSVTSGLTGLQFAESAASLNQGVSYLAGKVGVSVGGIAAVCQLIAALMPVAVTMVYLCAMRQVRCSFPMVSGFTAITLLPNIAALVLASVLGPITPYLSLLMLFFGLIVSYVLLCNMAAHLANLQPRRSVLVQSSLICLSEITKIALIAAIGGALMGSVIRMLTSLTNSMGGLL